jgi:murein DD-endopeptidase MepM/ murein hydrolase activator NlpD
MMKKITFTIFILLIVIFPFHTVNASKARTLGELKAELQALKNKYQQSQNNKANTQNQINVDKNSIGNKQNEITTNQKKVSDAMAESERLSIEIDEGKTKIKELLENYQVSKGNNVYLEYIFDATSYEDLVYRYALVEQVMNYQREEIDKWNNKIDQNTQLKKDLEAREIELNNQIANLETEIGKLGDKLSEYVDEMMDIKDEISSTQELIDYYKNLGCKDNQDLNECVSLLGDTKFIKPLVKGVITSYFGYRVHPISKKWKLHTGTDIGGNPEGTSVYSIANGKVGKIIRRASCGGNQVYVYHNINGKQYTSCYMHLKTINVNLGDKVSSTTVVGTVGGRTTTYDSCSTGAHLHLGLGTGWYGTSYTAYSSWISHLIDAKEKIGLPSKGTYWYSRY